jgi:hypothetical protein
MMVLQEVVEPVGPELSTDAANATVEHVIPDGPRSVHDPRHAGHSRSPTAEATHDPEPFTDGFEKIPGGRCGGAPRCVRASEPSWI